MLLFAALLGCSDVPLGPYVTRTDVFAQAASNELDVLWVVSTAPSMAGPQASLVAGVDAFADEVEERGLDVHLGVVPATVDWEDPDRATMIGDPPWLGTGDDLRAELPDRFLVGTAGGEERGLAASLLALEPAMILEGGPNAGFRRPDARLVVLYVSTRDDADTGPPDEVVDGLRNAGDPSSVTAQAVVGAAASGASCAEYGNRYLTVAALIGGWVSDVCALAADPGLGFPALTFLGEGLITEFALTAAAYPDSLEVLVDDAVVPEHPTDGWTYDPAAGPGGTLAFHGAAVPPRGSRIEVTYSER